MVGCKGLLPLRVALSSPEAPEALDGADLRQRKRKIAAGAKPTA